MKTLLSVCALMTFVIVLLANDHFDSKTFDATSPLDKLTVSVDSTPDIKAASIELTPRRFGLNRVLEVQAEIYNAEKIVIERKLVRLIEADLKSWINAADPDAWLQTFVLGKLALTAK